MTRNQSSVIAFKIPGKDFKGFQIMASHSDSPAFKIKENPEMEAAHCIKLNVEKYGGMICAPWFDRPLSIAGRLVVSEGSRLVSKLVNVDRDLVMIPNLAIHMNRQVNDGYAYNAQKDMLPVFGSLEAKGTFMSLMAEAAGVKEEDILGHDLFLYNRQPGTIWGADETFLSCGRLDDLQCAFSSVKAVIEGENSSSVSVAAIFDNEEVGSGTKQYIQTMQMSLIQPTVRLLMRVLLSNTMQIRNIPLMQYQQLFSRHYARRYRFRYRPLPTVLTLQVVPHWEIFPMHMFP